MNLETSVERAGLHGFPGAWRRCNSKRREWNDHSASLRLPCPAPGKSHTPARSTEVSRMNRKSYLKNFASTAARKYR
ncbi:MAG: hypothetical protein WC091_22310 [Sulfuricellaceae bacterium]